jgi:hypothetical protein
MEKDLINPNKKRGIEIKVGETFPDLRISQQPRKSGKFASKEEKRLQAVQKKYNEYAKEKIAMMQRVTTAAQTHSSQGASKITDAINMFGEDKGLINAVGGPKHLAKMMQEQFSTQQNFFNNQGSGQRVFPMNGVPQGERQPKTAQEMRAHFNESQEESPTNLKGFVDAETGVNDYQTNIITSDGPQNVANIPLNNTDGMTSDYRTANFEEEKHFSENVMMNGPQYQGEI